MSSSVKTPIKYSKLLRHYPDRAIRKLLIVNGFKSSFIKTSVAKQHVYVYENPTASLPPLAVLHGGADSGGSFALTALRLRKFYRKIIIVEAAGHGLSTDPLGEYTFPLHFASTFEVLDTLLTPDDPAIVVGNSLGGITAMKYALYAPKNVKALFLTSPMGAPMTNEVLAELRGLYSPSTKKAALAFIKRMRHKVSKIESLIIPPVALAFITRPAIKDLVRLTATTDYMPQKELSRLTLPVHIVCGKSDHILPPNSVEYFCKHLPHAT
ncbi:MAG TPA: alpha/beta fold hydrolase, partial [Patescibacteria group bacterium]|nr:alpha/beta fold hydrolase [Patescibacteria group bacterium]